MAVVKAPLCNSSTSSKWSSAITFSDKEGVPQTSRIGLAACAAGAQYTIPPALARHASDPRGGLRETLCYKLRYKGLQDPDGRPQFEAKKLAFRRFLKKSDVTTGYTSQNDLPVTTVKKNPLKLLFPT
jgi:hypothetical protein